MRIKLLICFLIMSILLFTACAAGGWKKIDVLRTEDFFSNKLIEIPLEFKYGSRDGTLSTKIVCKYSIAEMAEKVRKLSSEEVNYTVTEFQKGKLLIEIENAGGENAVVVLTVTTSRNTSEGYPNAYVFFSPLVQYLDTEFIIPFHLVKDDRLITYYQDTLQSDLKYATDYNRDDFLAFYKGLSDYYPQLDSDKIQVLDNGLIVSDNYVKGVTRNVKIEFHEENTRRYFTVQFDE